MLFEGRKTKSFVLGYDLGDEVSQISYLASDADMPETLSVLAGAELYNIPTTLCRRRDVNQWFFGKEAARRIENGDDIPVLHLVEDARKGDPVTIAGAEYDPVALLTLFIKRSLSLLSMEMSLEHIEAVMFTTSQLDQRMVEVLGKVTAGLGLKTDQVFYQSHEESMYNYMLYQPEDLWSRMVLACDYNLGTMSLYSMSLNHNTSPVVATVERRNYDELEVAGHSFPEDTGEKEKMQKLMDEDFLHIMTQACDQKIVTSVFLLGDGFREKWMPRTLEFLCRTRRVFQGNNMFSKGASIAARERLTPSPVFDKYVLLGDDKLRANVGITLTKQGVECYHALMDAGVNWYEAAAQAEMILVSGNEITMQKVSLTGGKPEMMTMVLDGAEERPERTTRIRMKVDMISVSQMRVQIEDLGFGELYPASGKTWTQTFDL
ncbi:MAG: DUF5716 family protein [Butyrivibrio sp.]|jgi:hypothetical protein|nr:DUF5716 family protein [Butyrivibrio sp.]